MILIKIIEECVFIMLRNSNVKRQIHVSDVLNSHAHLKVKKELIHTLSCVSSIRKNRLIALLKWIPKCTVRI